MNAYRNIYQELLDQIEKNSKACVVTRLGDKITKTLEENTTRSQPYIDSSSIDDSSLILREPYTRPDRLIICGGGHVSLALASHASRLGFHIIVIDDRESYANTERFPMASRVICKGFRDALQELRIGPQDYLVLLTRDHRLDKDCLLALYHEDDPAYLGMMGSKKRVTGLKELLAREEGIDPSWLNRIHAPIGLDIGGVTPEEIAISILAELIQVKRAKVSCQDSKENEINNYSKLISSDCQENTANHGNKPSSPSCLVDTDIDMDVIRKLASLSEEDKRKGYAILTIVSTEGSTPRKAGAKMVLLHDGRTFGTIGGGYAEGRLLKEAKSLMKKGGWKLMERQLLRDPVTEEGMSCGGSTLVLIEAYNQMRLRSNGILT